MEMIKHFISDELIYALGWTVMHSLWQAFAIAIILAFVLNVFRKKSAQVRYEASTIALFLVLVSAVSTFIWYFDVAAEKVSNANGVNFEGLLVGASDNKLGVLEGFLQSCINYFDQHLPVIVLIWLVGVGFFILRLIGGLVYVQRLRHFRTNELPEIWQTRINTISRKIPLRKTVKILESGAVKVPMVVGYLKPFILLPVGTVNQLDHSEVEAIIAHELAHVFRNDFLMNIFISFIEVFFYYNPAVWWISGNIRLERENCCDDIAVKICENSLTYAKALVRLQELNVYVPSFAMPFSGQKNQMLNRIRRILNQPQTRSNILEKLTATCFLLVAIVFMSVNANTIKPEVEVVEEISVDVGVEYEEEIVLNVTMDTIPEKQKILKGKSMEIVRSTDGEISKFIIDGEVISKEELEKYDRYKIEIEDSVIDISNKLKSDSISWPKSSEVFELRSRGSARPLIIKPGEALPKARFLTKREKTITKTINDDGQTIIVLETIGEDPVEILVDGSDKVIEINGNNLGAGDTTIIIESNTRIVNGFPKIERAEVRLFTDSITWRNDEKKIRGWLNKDRVTGFGSFPATKAERFFETPSLKGEARGFKQKLLQDELEGKIYRFEQLDNRNQVSTIEGFRFAEKAKGVELKRLYESGGRNENFFALLKRTKADFTTQMIAGSLKRDGMIKDINDFSFSVSRKKLKIDGKKQSRSLLEKYIRIYENASGNTLAGKAKYEINFKQE